MGGGEAMEGGDRRSGWVSRRPTTSLRGANPDSRHIRPDKSRNHPHGCGVCTSHKRARGTLPLWRRMTMNGICRATGGLP